MLGGRYQCSAIFDSLHGCRNGSLPVGDDFEQREMLG